MKLPYLPPITPPGRRPAAPAQNVVNPGCVSPSDQQFVAPSYDQGGSRSPGSASVVNSNGEMQHRNQHQGNVVSGTVTKTDGTAPVQQYSGDRYQRLDLRPSDPGQSNGGMGVPMDASGEASHRLDMRPPDQGRSDGRLGLTENFSGDVAQRLDMRPADVGHSPAGSGNVANEFPASQNPSRLIVSPPSDQPTASRPIDVDAGRSKPGGLPTNVIIR